MCSPVKTLSCIFVDILVLISLYPSHLGLLEEAKKLKSDKTQEHDKNEVAELKQKLAKALDEKASAEKSLAEIKSKPQEDKSSPKPVDTSTADRLRRYDMLYDEGRRINDIFGREIVEKVRYIF